VIEAVERTEVVRPDEVMEAVDNAELEMAPVVMGKALPVVKGKARPVVKGEARPVVRGAAGRPVVDDVGH